MVVLLDVPRHPSKCRVLWYSDLYSNVDMPGHLPPMSTQQPHVPLRLSLNSNRRIARTLHSTSPCDQFASPIIITRISFSNRFVTLGLSLENIYEQPKSTINSIALKYLMRKFVNDIWNQKCQLLFSLVTLKIICPVTLYFYERFCAYRT